MKITFVGGGNSRILGSIRELLKLGGVLDGSSIALYDINQESAESVARVMRQFPEMQTVDVSVSCPSDLDEALAGADFVEVIVGAWNWDIYYRSFDVCHDHGYIASENLGANSPFLALRSGAVALQVARRMEQVAPAGLLMLFSNPVPILTRMVNAYTSIKAIGICQGQIGHFMDVARVMKWDEPNFNIEAAAAGVNHCSWILGLSLDGQDLLPAIADKFARGIDFDRLESDPHWCFIEHSFRAMVDAYYLTGSMVFSIEGDGVPHIVNYDGQVRSDKAIGYPARVDELREGRERGHRDFMELSKQQLGADYWNADPSPYTPSHPRTVTDVCVLKGMLTGQPERVAVSYLNNGVVEGFFDDDVVEYTVEVTKDGFNPSGPYPCRLPPATLGVSRGMVEYQSLTAQAIVEEDAHVFEQAVYAYPMCRTKSTVDSFIAGMKEVSAVELPAWLSQRP